VGTRAAAAPGRRGGLPGRPCAGRRHSRSPVLSGDGAGGRARRSRDRPG
jgi:hypothetical protein